MPWHWKVTKDETRHCTVYMAINTCMQCGKEFRANNPSSTKYCPECGKLIRAQQNRDRVKRYRDRQKQACTE